MWVIIQITYLYTLLKNYYNVNFQKTTLKKHNLMRVINPKTIKHLNTTKNFKSFEVFICSFWFLTYHTQNSDTYVIICVFKMKLVKFFEVFFS